MGPRLGPNGVRLTLWSQRQRFHWRGARSLTLAVAPGERPYALAPGAVPRDGPLARVAALRRIPYGPYGVPCWPYKTPVACPKRIASMAALLAPLRPTLTPTTLMLIGFVLLWQRVSHLRDDMKGLRDDVKEGLERMERRFDKQQDLILTLTDPASQSSITK